MGPGRFILGFNAFAFLAFGLACLAHPDLLTDIAGLAFTRASATIEARAMYGGVQIGLGAFFALAFAREAHRRAGLGVALALFGGLALGRTVGVALAADVDAYTATALAYEWGFAALTGLALRRA